MGDTGQLCKSQNIKAVAFTVYFVFIVIGPFESSHSIRVNWRACILLLSFQIEIVCINNCRTSVYDTAERIKHGPYVWGAWPHGRSCWGGRAGRANSSRQNARMSTKNGVTHQQAMLNNLDIDFDDEKVYIHNDGVPSPSPPYTVSPRPPRLWVLLCAQWPEGGALLLCWLWLPGAPSGSDAAQWACHLRLQLPPPAPTQPGSI